MTSSSGQLPDHRRVDARAQQHVLLFLVVAILAVGLFLFPVFRGPGAAADEGQLLAYPALVTRGYVPYRHFFTFYGPAAPYVLAGGYELFGASQTTERAIGMAFRVVAVAAVFWLFLSSGTALAGLAALAAGIGLRTLGPSASAASGALAVALLSVAALAHARRVAGSARLRTTQAALLAGLLGGMSFVFRFDFAAALLLGSAPLLVGASRAVRVRWLAGLLIGPVLYIPFLWLTGLDRMRGVIDDIVRVQPDRHLPLPAVTTGDGLAFVVSIGAIVLAVIAAYRVRNELPDVRGSLLAGGLFALGLVPYFLSRADPSHLAPLRSVAIPTGIVAGVELAAWQSAVFRRMVVRAGGVATLVATAVVAGLGILAIAGSGPTGLRVPDNVKLRHGDRSFRVKAGPAAEDLQAVLDRVDRYARPGQRLFVGTTDLRYAEYNDTFVYYMLPHLRPASRYLELAPRMVNRRGSGLARDLARADVLILTSQYNAGARGHQRGPAEPNEVVRQRFCQRFVQREYELLTRCR